MAKNSESLFRKQSLKKSESLESIDSLIRVIRPGAWITLLAVAAALAGVFIWMIFGTISSGAEAVFRAEEDGKAVFYVSEEQAENLSRGSDLTVGDVSGKITSVAAEAVQADGVLDDYVMHVNGIAPGAWVVKIRTNVTVTAGIHKAQLVFDRISPVQLVLGR